MPDRFLLLPSLLSANFARLGEEAEAVLTAGGDALHLDVMDNHYVPNLTVGPLVCAALRKYGITADIDVHLMTTPVDRLIIDFAKAGASVISIHPEATTDIHASLNLIRQQGCRAGLAINPTTSLSILQPFIDQLDSILIMSVNPGFGGQAFIPSVLEKVKQARILIQTKKKIIRLAIDGGINSDTIYQAAMAGADTFVAGSAIFNQPHYAEAISALRNELKRAI